MRIVIAFLIVFTIGCEKEIVIKKPVLDLKPMFFKWDEKQPNNKDTVLALYGEGSSTSDEFGNLTIIFTQPIQPIYFYTTSTAKK